MKKLILLLFPILTFGQIERYVAFNSSIDVRNAIVGSQPTENKPEVDLQFGANIHLGNGITFGLNYESFKAIGYYKASYQVGYVIEPFNKVRVHTYIEPELIMRRGDVENYFKINDNFLGLSVNSQITYEVLPSLYLGLRGGLEARGDLIAAGYKDYMVFNGHLVVEYLIKID